MKDCMLKVLRCSVFWGQMVFVQDAQIFIAISPEEQMITTIESCAGLTSTASPPPVNQQPQLNYNPLSGFNSGSGRHLRTHGA